MKRPGLSRIRSTSYHAVTAVVAAFLVVGCASSPASQHQIARRNAGRAATMEDIRKSEARRESELRESVEQIRRYERRKESDFRESWRLAGERFW